MADKDFLNSYDFRSSSIKFRYEWHFRCISLLWVQLKDHINYLDFIASNMGITGKVAEELPKIIAARLFGYILHSETQVFYLASLLITMACV